ncbi:MAG: cell division protein FtsX [Sphingomonadales bacterium]
MILPILKPQFNILPDGARAGGLLPVIIAVMMYMSALSLFAALSLQLGIGTWSRNLDRSFTIQIPADAYDPGTLEDEIAKALKPLLDTTTGVASYEILSTADNKALLETWLGKGNVTDDLPVPALIDVKVSDGSAIDAATLEAALKTFKDARVDGAGTWLSQLRRPALALIANAYFILAVVLIAAVAVVVFGTRAQLAAHRPTIQIVHHMGAEDTVIAKEFQYSFMRLGLIGGAAGTVGALLTLVVLGMTLDGNEDGLLSIMRSTGWAMAAILPLPVLAAILTLITARMTVFHALRQIP